MLPTVAVRAQSFLPAGDMCWEKFRFGYLSLEGSMKKLALAVVAACLSFAGSASAADLAARPYTKAPPPVVAAVYDWTGIYVGGAVGGIWNDTSGNFYNAPGFGWSTGSHSDWI